MDTEAIALAPNSPWRVKEEDFPAHGTAAEQLKFLLHYAVLAPSGHNTQPWLFAIVGDTLHLYADRTRALPVVDPDDRQLIMSCGAALFHLRVALRHYGITPRVAVLPDPDHRDLLATLRLGPPYETTLADHRLFMAIKKRRTNRLPYEERPVPEEVLQRLQEIALTKGATLNIIGNPVHQYALADLIADGDRRQGRDKRFRRELAAWVHPNRSRSRDGIPGYAQGVGDVLSYAGPFVVRTFDWGRGQAARDRELAEGSPALLVLSTTEDSPAAWMAAGEALAHTLLLAADYGLHASFLNQPIEVAEMRSQVAALAGGAPCPHLILRMGYGPDLPATPRRPVHEVLIREPPA